MWSIFRMRKSQGFLLASYNRASQARQVRSTSHATNFLTTFNAPVNEPILDYSDPDTQHRKDLEKCLQDLDGKTVDIPIVINGREHRTKSVQYQRIPYEHNEKAARFYYATRELIDQSIDISSKVAKEWEKVPMFQRLDLFESAANLIAGKYRAKLNAATMIGQAKTIKQAEIDSAAELIDFLRFNAYYMKCLLDWQPLSTGFEINSTQFRRLDGFVAAISPFNFTAIGGNLASAPTIMGNGVLWKPSDGAVLSNYVTFKVFQEAGFPDGLINFLPAEGLEFGRAITSSSKLAGVNFTGSLATFQWIWSEVGTNIKTYDSFPRLVGECGGKNFHLVHKSADVDTVIAQTVRSAFEYSGQKCSACSRMYVGESLWAQIKDKLIETTKSLKIGPSDDFKTYTSAVIDAAAFKRISDYVSYAKATSNEIEMLYGGDLSDEVGYFVQPTIFQTKNPRHRLMLEEIFGPILTVFVYPDDDIDRVMDLVDDNEFALTGSIFAQDDEFVARALDRLRMCAGNIYVNDKSTGAVVGQQPFGGSRHSGTNDKAGGPHYLMKWCNQQTIKRTIKKLHDI